MNGRKEECRGNLGNNGFHDGHDGPFKITHEYSLFLVPLNRGLRSSFRVLQRSDLQRLQASPHTRHVMKLNYFFQHPCPRSLVQHPGDLAEGRVVVEGSMVVSSRKTFT